MRLIDADKLLERIKTSNDYLGKWDEMNIHDIEAAPTINAIPIAWIEKWIAGELRINICAGNWERNLSARNMIEDWKTINRRTK